MENIKKKTRRLRLTSEQKTQLRQVGFKMNPTALHVNNDPFLKAYMGTNLKAAYILARYLKWQYEAQYKLPIRITTLSLAVELIGHFWVQEVCVWWKEHVFRHIPGKRFTIRFCDRVIRSTEVIDCGERECDNNRIVWDVLSKPTKIIWRMKK